MTSFLKNLGKLGTGSSKSTGPSDAEIQEAFLLKVQQGEAEEKKAQGDFLGKIESGERQENLSSGNIFQRTWAGLKEGNEVAKENQEALGPQKPPSLKKQMLEVLFPPLAMLDPHKRASFNRVGVPLSRSASAILDPVVSAGMDASQKVLQTTTKPLQTLFNNTLFKGKKGEERREAWGDVMVAPAKKAMEEYQSLSPEDQAKLKNIGLFAESLSAFSTLPMIGKGLQLGKEAALAGFSKVPGTKAISNVLKGSAEKQLGKVFSPSTIGNKLKTKRIVSSMVSGEEKLPLALTREGLLKKVGAKKSPIGMAIGEFEDSGKLSGSTKTKIFTDWLKEKRGEFVEKGAKGADVVMDEDFVKSVDDLTKTINQFGKDIPDQKLLNIRRKLDAITAKKGGFDRKLVPNTDLDIKDDFTDVIREELSKKYPDLKALNSKFSFYKNVEKVLGDTIERKTGQSSFTDKMFGGAIATPVGLVTGSTLPTMALGAAGTYGLYKTVTSTGWRLVSASLKSRLAKAMVSGDKAAIAKVLQEINKEMGVAAAVGATGVQIPQSVEKATDLQKLKGTKFYEDQKSKGVPLY